MYMPTEKGTQQLYHSDLLRTKPNSSYHIYTGFLLNTEIRTLMAHGLEIGITLSRGFH